MQYTDSETLVAVRARLSTCISGLTLLAQGQYGRAAAKNLGRARLAALKAGFVRMQNALRPKNSADPRLPIYDYVKLNGQLQQVEALLATAQAAAQANPAA